MHLHGKRPAIRRGACCVSGHFGFGWLWAEAHAWARLRRMERIDLPDASAQPVVYRDALLAVLGDRDALDVMTQTLAQLPRLVQGLTDAEWTQPAEPSEWSPAQLLGHFFDVDLVFGFRWRLTVTADRPTYPGYDEKAFMELARPEPRRLLDAWRGLREANLAMLRALPEEACTRLGVHGEQGEEALRMAVDKFAGHDLAHLNQMHRSLPAR
jgi:hypothetical protein